MREQQWIARSERPTKFDFVTCSKTKLLQKLQRGAGININFALKGSLAFPWQYQTLFWVFLLIYYFLRDSKYINVLVN